MAIKEGFEILTRDTLEFWSNYLVRAEVTIDGKVYEYPIFKKRIKDNNIRFLIYVTGNKGKVTELVVYNRKNEPVRVLESNLEKGKDGLIMVLSWTLKIEEGYNG